MASPQRDRKLLWKSADQKSSSIETWRGDPSTLSTSYATERGRRTSRPSKGGPEPGKERPLTSKRKSHVEIRFADPLKGRYAAHASQQSKDQDDVTSLLNRGPKNGLYPPPQSARTIPKVPLSARGGQAAGKKEESGSLTARTHSNFVEKILSVRNQRVSQGLSEPAADSHRPPVKDLPRLNLSTLNPYQGASSSYRGPASTGKTLLSSRYVAENSKDAARVAKLIGAYGAVGGGTVQARKSKIVAGDADSNSDSDAGSRTSTSDEGPAVSSRRQARSSTSKDPAKSKQAELASFNKKMLAIIGKQNGASDAHGPQNGKADASARRKTKSRGADVSRSAAKWSPREVTSPATSGAEGSQGGVEPRLRKEGGLEAEPSEASVRSSKDRLKVQIGGEASPAGSTTRSGKGDASSENTPRRMGAKEDGSAGGTPKRTAARVSPKEDGETPRRTTGGASEKEVKSQEGGGGTGTGEATISR
jgi:hypothetical protein